MIVTDLPGTTNIHSTEHDSAEIQNSPIGNKNTVGLLYLQETKQFARQSNHFVYRKARNVTMTSEQFTFFSAIQSFKW